MCGLDPELNKGIKLSKWSSVIRTSDTVLSTFFSFCRCDQVVTWLSQGRETSLVAKLGALTLNRVFQCQRTTDTLTLYCACLTVALCRFSEWTLIYYHKVSVLMLTLPIVFVLLINMFFFKFLISKLNLSYYWELIQVMRFISSVSKWP